MVVVEDDPFMRTRVTEFDAGEVLVVAEEVVESLERIPMR
jgi:hypothetical protein